MGLVNKNPPRYYKDSFFKQNVTSSPKFCISLTVKCAIEYFFLNFLLQCFLAPIQYSNAEFYSNFKYIYFSQVYFCALRDNLIFIDMTLTYRIAFIKHFYFQKNCLQIFFAHLWHVGSQLLLTHFVPLVAFYTP